MKTFERFKILLIAMGLVFFSNIALAEAEEPVMPGMPGEHEMPAGEHGGHEMPAEQEGGEAPASNCDDTENSLFISLSTDDTWKASMALGYAKKNLEHGPVTIFMNVTGTRIAVKEEMLPHDFYALNRKSTQESLKAFLKAGGRGLVCPNCIVRAGFKAENIIEHNNIEMGAADLVRSELDCSSKQLSW